MKTLHNNKIKEMRYAHSLLKALCIQESASSVKKIIALIFLLQLDSVTAQEVEFEGFPSRRVQSSFDNRVTSDLNSEESREFAVKIVRDGDNFFWETRENTPLVKIESGIYITYIAANGSGYIRTLNETAREAFLQAPDNNQIGQITYIEHLLLGLESITYYGR